jgi:hypothetical protein
LGFVLRRLSRTRFFITNANPACSCVYICKFQFRPIHPPSRRLSIPPVQNTDTLLISLFDELSQHVGHDDFLDYSAGTPGDDLQTLVSLSFSMVMFREDAFSFLLFLCVCSGMRCLMKCLSRLQ